MGILSGDHSRGGVYSSWWFNLCDGGWSDNNEHGRSWTAAMTMIIITAGSRSNKARGRVTCREYSNPSVRYSKGST